MIAEGSRRVVVIRRARHDIDVSLLTFTNTKGRDSRPPTTAIGEGGE
jgi:hypothetical protein